MVLQGALVRVEPQEQGGPIQVQRVVLVPVAIITIVGRIALSFDNLLVRNVSTIRWAKSVTTAASERTMPATMWMAAAATS